MLLTTLMHDSMFDQVPYATSDVALKDLTLRNVNTEYRDSGGSLWIEKEPPEQSGGSDDTTGPCMARFDNIVGHVSRTETLVIEYRYFGCSHDLVESLADVVNDCINTGHLWTLPNLKLCVKDADGSWYYSAPDGRNDHHSSELLRNTSVLTKLSERNFVPLSVGTSHAAMERSFDNNRKYMSRYIAFPRSATPSTGLIGTYHNNQAVDMLPFEPENNPNARERSFRDDYYGFICPGHTPHNLDAGRVRHVTRGTSVRILSHKLLSDIRNLYSRFTAPGEGDDPWTVYCMGYCLLVSPESMASATVYHKLTRMMPCSTFSLHIHSDARVCVVSISPGVLISSTSNHMYADSVEVHKSDRLPSSVDPVVDTRSDNSMEVCFSSYFNLCPYVSSDMPPRPTITSAQQPQAVCLPWCPASAAVSPCYTFKPLVTTKMYREIMNEQGETPTFADYMIGENVCVLYLNKYSNYEDSIEISSKYVDMGGFSTLSICRYSLPYGDVVPDPGEQMCRLVFSWWKGPCPKHCRHTRESLKNRRVYTTGRVHTGVAVSKQRVKSGDWLVKIRSFQQLQTGDKVTTLHGQKGVVTVVPHEEMDVVVTKSGETIIPDVVFAMSSVVTRQTTGQFYEGQTGLDSLRDSQIKVVNQNDSVDHFEEVNVHRSSDYERYTTIFGPSDSAVRKDTLATIGYIRMANQTQMTREKHFTFSRTVNSSTLRTPVRRTRGGGVAFGEMEVQAAVASGLSNCVKELTRRGDLIMIGVCKSCQRLRLLCGCTEKTDTISVCLPFDTALLDCVSAISHHGSNVYSVAPDV